ncbi:MAG: hypothetical protein H0V17_15650 [Deltaproteobacteria bacterium]|nr:hypothetical protein [Deltaproteobacteria bacterium]
MRLVLSVLLAGCIAQARTAIDPPASGGGTLTCRQIVEQCDTQCSNPMCVRACGNQGTVDGAALHNAVVDCAQRNSCVDQECIEAQCNAEAQACRGPEPEGEPVPNNEPPPPLAPVVQ